MTSHFILHIDIGSRKNFTSCAHSVEPANNYTTDSALGFLFNKLFFFFSINGLYFIMHLSINCDSFKVYLIQLGVGGFQSSLQPRWKQTDGFGKMNCNESGFSLYTKRTNGLVLCINLWGE